MAETLARDTTLAAETRQITLFRSRTVIERLALAFDLTAFAVAASRAAIRRAHPHLSPLEQARLLFGLQFGMDRAIELRSAPSVEGRMAIPSAILPVVDILENLEVPYFITGSIASSAYSLPRTTYDVDIVAALEHRHVARFVTALQDEYYVDQQSVHEAITHHSSFKLTHQATGINLDLFIPAHRPFDRVQLPRAQAHHLPGMERMVKLASPEDVILNKLVWYEAGNRVSDQQWRDVQSILRVQDHLLDLAYLRFWAAELNINALLETALRGEHPHNQPPDAPDRLRLF